MSKIQCRCGEWLDGEQVPSDIIIKAYPDRQYDDMLDFFERDNPEETPPEPKIVIWQCPTCRRMYVFENGSSKPVIYKFEHDYTKEYQ